MRVLMTTDTVGGVWTFTHELAAGLLQGGSPVLLVSFGRGLSLAQRAQCTELEKDYPGRFRCIPTTVPTEWMERNERVFEDGGRILQELIRKFAPDVIHSNQFCYGAIESDVPCIVTAHSDMLSWARACHEDGVPNTDWLRRYVAIVQAGLSGCDAVAAPTSWMLHALEQSFALPDRAMVIPHGRSIAVDFNGARELRAVTAGRVWDEAKGIRLLEHVRSSMPMVIAGDDDAGAPISGRIGEARFAGMLSEPEMIDLLQTSSVYVCLSRYESFGLAPLEAALCGCAVVARDIPALREVWGDGALFYTDGDQLSRVLDELHSNAKFLRGARERSYAMARSFTRKRMIDAYLSLYRHVLQHRKMAHKVA